MTIKFKLAEDGTLVAVDDEEETTVVIETSHPETETGGPGGPGGIVVVPSSGPTKPHGGGHGHGKRPPPAPHSVKNLFYVSDERKGTGQEWVYTATCDGLSGTLIFITTKPVKAFEATKIARKILEDNGPKMFQPGS